MIDYEAAADELTKWLAEREGIADATEAARFIVDAALGNERFDIAQTIADAWKIYQEATADEDIETFRKLAAAAGCSHRGGG